MQKEITLTSEGLNDLKQELEHLRTAARKDIAEKIKVALSFGDLSENSEYDEAKSEQAKIEARIGEIEAMLPYVKVLDENDISIDTVGMGSKVKLKDLEEDEIVNYKIVGFAQADPDEGQISDESPLGKALTGQKAGTTVEVEAPMGILKFEILEISK